MNSRTSLGYFSSINASTIVKGGGNGGNGEGNLKSVVEEELDNLKARSELREDDQSPKKASSMIERPRFNN